MTKRESQKADYESEARIVGHAVDDSTPTEDGTHRATVILSTKGHCVLTPQLENAYSRAGILFGLLNAGITEGYLVMLKDTEDIEYKYRVEWMSFSLFVTIEHLGKVGVSLAALADTAIEDWNRRLKQLRKQQPK